jgi:hypothetical protein
MELPMAPRTLFESICMILQLSRIHDVIVVRALVLLGVLRKNRSPLIKIIPNRLVLFVTALMLSQKSKFVPTIFVQDNIITVTSVGRQSVPQCDMGQDDSN